MNPDAANDRPKEILVFHDTAGISDYGPVELRRPYIQVKILPIIYLYRVS